MSSDTGCCLVSEQVEREFRHLRMEWWWLLLFGVLLAVCGAAAIVFPVLTVITTVAAMIILGVTLMIAGVATIVAAFWAGKWSGLLLQLLIGVVYVMLGFMITDTPVLAAGVATAFVAAFFIVVGGFRILAALLVRFPKWGWALLNGTITFLLGVIIYRFFPQAWPWVLGLLIGVELLVHGWMWIVLALAIRRIPQEANPEAP